MSDPVEINMRAETSQFEAAYHKAVKQLEDIRLAAVRIISSQIDRTVFGGPAKHDG